MRVLFRAYWGPFIDDLERFRAEIVSVTPEAYKGIYERMPRIQDETDNSQACLSTIAENVVGQTVCDVGCGTGYLLRYLREQPQASNCRLTGVDFVLEEGASKLVPTIEFVAAPIERLPFADRHFDTVICTHVLEHILDIRAAVTELRRIAARKLIIVVPLEREYRFTFNPHIHFFPYPHSFTRHIIPVPANHSLRVIGRDLVYIEDMS